MKIRTDYVTNSSSSSFILGFKSEKDIEKTLEKELSWARDYKINPYGYADEDETFDAYEKVLSDCIEAKKMTKEEMLKLAEKDMKWTVEWAVEDRVPWREQRQYRGSSQFKKDCKAEMINRLSAIQERAERTGSKIFVEVSYSDHTHEGSELEHNIVPNMTCCIKCMNHH